MEGKIPPKPDEYKFMIKYSQMLAQGADKKELDKLEAEYDAQCKAYGAWSRRGRNPASLCPAERAIMEKEQRENNE
jgi:hypothetical protein